METKRQINGIKNRYHRDRTITYWSVYRQLWVVRAGRVPDRELSAMNEGERRRIERHLSPA